MSDDIPDEDYGSAMSRVISDVASDTNVWDAAEMALIGAVLFVGGQILLGNPAMIPVFAGLLGVWGIVAGIAESRVDERVAVRETGWRQETTEESTRVGDPQDCTGHHTNRDDGSVPCTDAGRGRVIRSYDVLEIGGYEVYRDLNTENVYCRNHYALEYPAESSIDIEDIIDEESDEADEDTRTETDKTVTPRFQPASDLHRR